MALGFIIIAAALVAFVFACLTAGSDDDDMQGRD